MVALVIFAGLGAGGWYLGRSEPTNAAVGDCVTPVGADDVSVVGCKDPTAQFVVEGRLEDRTMIDAGLFACAAFPRTTSAFWQGERGATGVVLCLAPVPTPPAAPSPVPSAARPPAPTAGG